MIYPVAQSYVNKIETAIENEQGFRWRFYVCSAPHKILCKNHPIKYARGLPAKPTDGFSTISHLPEVGRSMRVASQMLRLVSGDCTLIGNPLTPSLCR